MSEKTIDSNAMAGMFIEIQDRDERQKRTIYILIAMLVIVIVAIGFAACDNAKINRALAYQDGVITDQAKVIRQKTAQITQLEKQLTAAKAEATKTSRGADRTATITAYTWTGNQTASGTWPKEGRTVAGPSWIPFGTRVYIDGIGWRIIEDRTHPKYDGRYDVYMDDHGRCMAWGDKEEGGAGGVSAMEGQLTMDDLLKREVDPVLMKLQKRYESSLTHHDRWDPYSSPLHILYDLDTQCFGSADPLYLDLKQKLIERIDTERYLELYVPHRIDEFYGYPRFASDRVKAYIQTISARMPDKQLIPARNPKHDHMTEAEFDQYIHKCWCAYIEKTRQEDLRDEKHAGRSE